VRRFGRSLQSRWRIRLAWLECSLWQASGKPESGYVWPAETNSGYVNDETLRRAHLKVLKASGVRHFVLHSIRAHLHDPP
jgi:hypothetical protein